MIYHNDECFCKITVEIKRGGGQEYETTFMCCNGWVISLSLFDTYQRGISLYFFDWHYVAVYSTWTFISPNKPNCPFMFSYSKVESILL